MAHNKKKLSLSERFGSIGSGSDYHNKARSNSEMVSQLQKQISEVVKKRKGEDCDRESQAKMINEEISDIQQRFDDAPVISSRFQPFKVNISNKNAKQMNSNRNETVCYNRNTEESCNTSNDESKLNHGQKGINDQPPLETICKDTTSPTAPSDVELSHNLCKPNKSDFDSANRTRSTEYNMMDSSAQSISDNDLTKSGQNFDKRKGSKPSPGTTKSQVSKKSPELNKGPSSKKSSPKFNKRADSKKTSPKCDKAQDSKTSPSKGESFHTTFDLNQSSNALTTRTFSKGRGSQKRFHNSTNYNRRPNFQPRPNSKQTHQTKPSAGQPTQHKGPGFPGSSNGSLEKGSQGHSNVAKSPGFQSSPGFQRGVPQSFGRGRETNVQKNQSNTLTSDGPGAIYDIQDQFYNYQSGNSGPKGRQQKGRFQNNDPRYEGHCDQANQQKGRIQTNNSGFDGHPAAHQQRSFPSNSSPHYHDIKTSHMNPETLFNNEQRPGYTPPSTLLHSPGGFGKRLASPLASNQFMTPAKRRVLDMDPSNNEVPSLKNRLLYSEKHTPSNTHLQGSRYASSTNAYAGNCSTPHGYYPGHVTNTVPQPPVTGNYGLALHGPFTPKAWNMSNQNFTPTFGNTSVPTADNFHRLNETDNMASTKQYLFNKMISEQNHVPRPTESILKPSDQGASKPFGGIANSHMQPNGDVQKPTGFYQEIVSETSGPRQNEKEETELVSTLLTQCQAMAQKDDDRQALNTIFNIIHKEMGHQNFQTPVKSKSKVCSSDLMRDKPRTVSETSLYIDEAKFSPTSSSPDASKQNGSMRFEGRTLLKGGVKPRHIPKTVVNKQDDDPPRDPRPGRDCKSKPARKMKDLPLPPFFIEFVATEKFGKKKKVEAKLNSVTEANTEEMLNEEIKSIIPSSEINRNYSKIDVDNVDGHNITSANTEQQQTVHGSLGEEAKAQERDVDPSEKRKTEVISPILPLITVRQEPCLKNVPVVVDICSRDPRLRSTSISKKRENNIVDFPLPKFQEYSEDKCDPQDREKVVETVADLKPANFDEHKGRQEATPHAGHNEAYLLTNVRRDMPKSQQRSSPSYQRDRRDTSIPRSVRERSLDRCDPRDKGRQFSERPLTHQRRHSGNYNTKEGNRFGGSPSSRYNIFSSERTLSRSRSSSRSRDGERTEKEAVRRPERISHKNVSHSYEGQAFVYKDRQGEYVGKQFQERNEFEWRKNERRSVSPGTCRYLKRRDMERKNTPPISIDRNVYRNRYQGGRNRNYSEGSDYPESYSSPLR
ncbi:uncharacterized protein [Argopecten irradians]|uniref:uncharacterized protein n=1 Tax=Argopecten irradians TaxID=31199 RepID=UPI003719F038